MEGSAPQGLDGVGLEQLAVQLALHHDVQAALVAGK